jgi:hypothetical protein
LLNQFQRGFDDWENVTIRITTHEQSKYHLSALSSILQCQKASRIGAELQKEKENL